MDPSGVIDPLAVPDWDARIAAFPAASFFHTQAWARVLRGAYGFKTHAMVEGPADRPTAILPFVEVDSRLTGRRGVSLPFSDVCDILFHEPDQGRRLVERVIGHGRTRHWKYWEGRGGHDLFPAEPGSTTFFGHHLDLSPGHEAIRRNFDESTRRAIRKAEKCGVVVEFSRELEDVRAFHQLLGLTRRRHGMPVQPFEFFRQIRENVLSRGLGWVALARHQGRPVAGAVYFLQGRAAVYKFGASDEREQTLRGNNLVMARAIEKFCADGLMLLDFGRTSAANDGLRRFKLSWGAREHPIGYLRFRYSAGAYVASPDQSAGWPQRVFRFAPLFLSRLVGRIVYKHLS
ncbi:MAG TPA: GNAT family N-acetyltransferase [Candidatus Didemnitutus sp.]|jgi:hypothetical protein